MKHMKVKLWGIVFFWALLITGCLHSQDRRPVLARESKLPMAETMRLSTFNAAVQSHQFTWNYLGRQTDDGDLGPASAWCNANGDWGTSAHVSNHSIWGHRYYVLVRFGHDDGAG